MQMQTAVEDLTQKEYELFRRLVYEKSGINLGSEKMQLVRARLGKRLRQGGFGSFRAYYDYVVDDTTGEALGELLDSISTNTTHLFRESQHFTLLKQIIVRWASDAGWRSSHDTLRIWSAGCSSGEEPHSLVMLAADALRAYPGIELKILASDISSQMLTKAKLGLYEPHRVGTVPDEFRRRCFVKVTDEGRPFLQLSPDLRQRITFAKFNLMTPKYPFKSGFDVIFCRNVMIYFDKKTQEQLVAKFAGQLHGGGYLMIGHSESLNSIEHPLAYVQPTVYRKD